MRVVLIGTGTGVGKTAVACALGRALEQGGARVMGLKPVESGSAPGVGGAPAAGSDAASLEAAVFHVEHPRPHPLYALEPALSPHLAARRTDQAISLNATVDWVARAEVAAGTHSRLTVLIETAGGAFSPLTLRHTNVDLAKALAADLVVLVARDRLGVLHEIRSTTLAMAAAWRGPDCVVLVPAAEPDASAGTNAAELRRLQPELDVFETGSRGPSSGPLTGDCPALNAWVQERLRAL